MAFQITLSNDKPSIENTDSLEQHRVSTPSAFSLNEKEVLYGGGHYFMSISLQQLNKLLLRDGPGGEKNVNLSCWLYIMERRIYIWLQEENIGLSVPYQCIILHGLNGDELYLQASQSTADDSSFEFLFASKEVAPTEIEPLLQSFGSGITETYAVICQREDCNIESCIDEEVPHEDEFAEYCEVNGQADDLDEFRGTTGSKPAAVSVDIERKKSRKVEDCEEQKRRRIY